MNDKDETLENWVAFYDLAISMLSWDSIFLHEYYFYVFSLHSASKIL